MDPIKPLTKDSDKAKDAWHGHRFHGAGTHSSEATVLTRESSHTLVNVTTTASNFAVQLPLTAPSTTVPIEATAKSTGPAPTYAVVGDVVEICVDPGSPNCAYVWYGATTADSALGHYEEVNPGKCRVYRYVSGAVWNRYT
jgi:hypothetical protein